MMCGFICEHHTRNINRDKKCNEQTETPLLGRGMSDVGDHQKKEYLVSIKHENG